MKTTLIPSIALAAALFAAAPLRAQISQGSPQALLVSRPWRFISDRSYTELAFAPDGTFKTIGIPDQAGSWVVTPDAVTLTYADSHSEVMSLPLNPAGTDCVDQDARHLTAIIGKILPLGAASSLDSNNSLDASPLDSAPSDTAGNRRQGRGRQPKTTPSAAPATDPFAGLPPSPTDQKQNAPIIALLTSAPWKILGQASYGTYAFDPSGAITSAHGDKPAGAWKISGNQLQLSFDKGGTEILNLPLDPKGTDGADSHGTPIIALQQAAMPVTVRTAPEPPTTAAAATTAPSSTFGTPNPAPGATATQGPAVPDHPFGTQQPPQQ